MNKLDDHIPESDMSYREKIELAVSDKRGNFILTNELDEVDGGRSYAEERIKFWKNWNQNYAKEHRKVNTQERYVKAQLASKDYAMAVYKSIVLLICNKVKEQSNELPTEKCVENIQELLWMFSGGSVIIMKRPLETIRHISRIMKKRNFSISFYLDIKFQNSTDADVKEWIKKVS